MSEQKNKPKDTNFKQQTLPGFQPIYTPKLASIVFFIASILFLVFGLPLYLLAESVIEVSKRYDHICDLTEEETCRITIEIDKQIPEPVFIYYHLSNFYQNHRLYVRSRSYTQLRDSKASSTELDLCKPAKYNRNFKNYTSDYTERNLKDSDVAVPCGMVARSVFTDTYSFPEYEKSLSFDDIVYKSDKDIWVSGDDENGKWREIDDRLRVWMKISLFSNFRKLWGKIEKNVKKGKLTVLINNTYDVNKWNGEKRIVLSNSSALGGKNTALGIVFIVAGSFCMLCSLIFIVSGVLTKAKYEGDPRSFKY